MSEAPRVAGAPGSGWLRVAAFFVATRLRVVCLSALCLGGWCASAHADVWVFVDDKGVARFSSYAIDERYELFLRHSPGAVDLPSEGVLSGAMRPFKATTGQSKLLAFFDVSPSYKSVKYLIRHAANAHEVDFELLQAVIVAESGFDRFAVSPRGAVGLMQVMPTTAERFGVQADKGASVQQKLTDAQTNIRVGVYYLRYLLKMFPGRTDLALAAYNAGEGAVKRAGNQVPDFKETRNYVATVMQIYEMLKPPKIVSDLRKATASALPATVPGGAVGRRNMIAPVATAAQTTFAVE